MLHMVLNFTSGLKKVMTIHYKKRSTFLFFVDNFSLSEEESSGEEMEGTYTYLGSQVVWPL